MSLPKTYNPDNTDRWKTKKFGDDTIVFDKSRHWYYVNGEYTPSVTTALGVINKPALIPWAVNQAIEYIKLAETRDDKLLELARKEWRSVKKEAADIGTKVHDYAEQYFKGSMPEDLTDQDERVVKGFNAFLEWVDSIDLDTEATETMVCDGTKYAGTLDWIGRVDGVPTIIDFKTSKGIYAEALLQVSAYAHAVNKVRNNKIEKVIIARFDKLDGSFEVKGFKSPEINQFYKGFESAITLSNVLKEAKGWLK